MSERKPGLVKGFVCHTVFKMGIGTNPERTMTSL